MNYISVSLKEWKVNSLNREKEALEQSVAQALPDNRARAC